ARPNIHGLERIEAAGEILIVRHFTGARCGDDNLDDLGPLRTLRVLAAGGEHGSEHSGEDSDPGERNGHSRSPATRLLRHSFSRDPKGTRGRAPLRVAAKANVANETALQDYGGPMAWLH